MTAFQLEQKSDGIAWLTFDLPGEKVNKLSISVLQELEQIIDTLQKRNDIKVLVIRSAKDSVFIAGADIKSFQKGFKDPAPIRLMIDAGQRVFKKIENLPFPSVALIQGGCFGGGTELALACTYRVVTDNPKTTIGLPEVNLGIFPGWGGTQRLPRLIGLLEGLPMVLSGRPVNAVKAYKLHLADAIVPWQFQQKAVENFLKKIQTQEGKKAILERRDSRGMKSILLEKNPIGRAFVFSKARKELKNKTKGHYPAPVAALNLIEKTITMPLNKGLECEANAFVEGSKSAFTAAPDLIQIFFTSEALKKYTGVPEGIKPRTIQNTAVVGAGVMGSGIAWLFSNKDLPVRLKDINWEAVGKGLASAKGIYKSLIKHRKLKVPEADLKFLKIGGTIDYSGFKHVDLVVEAAVENLPLKIKLLKELEECLPPTSIIGSNTSSLTIDVMAQELKHPERFVGMHFFNPPNKMPLVEVVKGPKTSDETIATTVDFCKKMGKTPIVVGDCPGFLVNRIFMLGCNEVMWMLEEGVNYKDLEKMMLDFGMPMSPFVLMDEVGNDITAKVAKIFEAAYGGRMKAPKIVFDMEEHHFYGKKVGKGFFLYEGDKRKEFNPEVLKLLPKPSKDVSNLSEREMSERVMLVMVNEAARCLQEGIIDNPAFLDMALIMGIGFPPFRGGLLRYADSLGIDYVVGKLQQFESKYGKRFSPSDYLLEMKKEHRSFYKSMS